jgi:hypothetical protein
LNFTSEVEVVTTTIVISLRIVSRKLKACVWHSLFSLSIKLCRVILEHLIRLGRLLCWEHLNIFWIINSIIKITRKTIIFVSRNNRDIPISSRWSQTLNTFSKVDMRISSLNGCVKQQCKYDFWTQRILQRFSFLLIQ